MTSEQLQKHLKQIGLGHKVLLGVGPMSKNTVDAVIQLTNVLNIPIQLIASRRQIECEELGGGYVNGWTTESFAKYVQENGRMDRIMLCRDHGGPWQGAGEEKLGIRAALERAKVSYEADIRSGFNVIHLDPSLRDRPMEHIKRDVRKLLEHCESLPGAENVFYECGTEETNGKTTEARAFADFVAFSQVLSPKIRFVVGQTGTLVKETRNVGAYSAERARELVAVCNSHGVMLKERNLDYACEMVLRDHRPAGIHSVNVAPEFGVAETKKLLELLQQHKLKKERKRFLQIALDSRKWDKWVVSELTDEEKAIIAGHYVFGHPEVQEIRAALDKEMYLDDVLRTEIQLQIMKYLRQFGWMV